MYKFTLLPQHISTKCTTFLAKMSLLVVHFLFLLICLLIFQTLLKVRLSHHLITPANINVKKTTENRTHCLRHRRCPLHIKLKGWSKGLTKKCNPFSIYRRWLLLVSKCVISYRPWHDNETQLIR